MSLSDLAPAVVVLLGALLSASGAIWASVEQSRYQRELRAKSDEIAALNHRLAGLVTGGDSFGYLSLSTTTDPNAATLIFVQQGEYPLYDVAARVADLAHWDPPKVPLGSYDTTLKVGNVANGTAMILGNWSLPKVDAANYNIFFSARNGFWTQQIRARRVRGEWKTATRVIRSDGAGEKILWERVDDAFPREKDATVRW